MASSRRSATNETVNTYHSGGGYDYSSLATWESATDTDHVTNTDSDVLEIKAGAHDDIINASSTAGYNDASYHRIMRPVSGEGHNGIAVFDGSIAAFDITSTGNSGRMFKCDSGDNYFEFQDIVMKYDASGINDAWGIALETDMTYIIGCIVVDSVSDNNAVGIFLHQGSGTIYAINCIAAGNSEYNFESINTTVSYVYNCTAYNAGKSDFRVSTGTTMNAKNCIIPSESVAGTFNKTTCISGSDSTYVDAANNDFHLVGTDTNARNQGTDLSSDANFAFDDDINSRSMGAAKAGTPRTGSWDIGADQFTMKQNVT